MTPLDRVTRYSVAYLCEGRAGISRFSAIWERGESELKEGDRGVMSFSALVWTSCTMAAACWGDAIFCAGGWDDASLGAVAGETGVVVG